MVAAWQRWAGCLGESPAECRRSPHQLFAAKSDWTRPSGAAAGLSWIRGVYRAMRPFVSGFAYQNYIDPDLTSWPHAYYGANLPRLVDVKTTYDPDEVFRFRQGIRAA